MGILGKISATGWIFIAMAFGVALGVLAPDVAKELTPASNIFLKLIKSIIAPLLFATLVYGIAASGNVKTMGRVGGKAILYFEIVTTVALFLGLAAVNIIKPGVGRHVEPSSAAAPAIPVLKQPPTVGEILEHTFPASIIDAMGAGPMPANSMIFTPARGPICVPSRSVIRGN